MESCEWESFSGISSRCGRKAGGEACVALFIDRCMVTLDGYVHGADAWR